MLSIGTGDGPPELDRAVRLADRYSPDLATVGVHPHEASKVTRRKTYRRPARPGPPPKVVAFGEIGLDYHYDFSPREVQREVFIEQLKLARDLKPPHHHPHPRSLGRHHVDPPRTLVRTRHHALLYRRRRAGRRSPRTWVFTSPSEASSPSKPPTPSAKPPASRPTTGSLSRPTPPTWRPSLGAESATNRHDGRNRRKLAEVRGTTPEDIAAITTANFEKLCLRPSNATRYTGVSDGN
jgi:hypothetical protein